MHVHTVSTQGGLSAARHKAACVCDSSSLVVSFRLPLMPRSATNDWGERLLTHIFATSGEVASCLLEDVSRWGRWWWGGMTAYGNDAPSPRTRSRAYRHTLGDLIQRSPLPLLPPSLSLHPSFLALTLWASSYHAGSFSTFHSLLLNPVRRLHYMSTVAHSVHQRSCVRWPVCACTCVCAHAAHFAAKHCKLEQSFCQVFEWLPRLFVLSVNTSGETWGTVVILQPLFQ